MKFCPKLKSENNITFHQDVFCGMQEVKKYYISLGLLYKKVNSFTIPKQFVWKVKSTKNITFLWYVLYQI